MRPPPPAAAAQRDVLLATKLHVPQPRPGFLPRPRLLERLTEATARELVLVCTPAGFGKTTLLGDWARHSRRPVAWLSLDQGDNDPARFWRHVTAALDRVRPGVGERVAGLLGPPTPPSFEGLVTALINELAAQPDRVLLVLDDYHLVDAQPVRASLAFLVEHLPPGLRLVLASRADPPLPLARLRARGQLAELRAAELRFTAEEAAALLREAIGPELPDATVTVLAARTEGWAAGLQLAVLSLRGQADVAEFVEGFSGSHRYVLDYLTEEVLDRQPEDLRGFLLETSVLERLSGELCDTVTGRTDGQAMLEQVERANLFLVPLDEQRRWWRYHHLFADLLRGRLAREQPERLPGLHQAAAAWSEQHGLVDDAIRHALAAGDTLPAARLLERHLDELLLRGEHATVDRWLAALPAELVSARPRLLLTQARLTLNSGRLEAVDGLLEAAERAFADAAEEPYAPSVGRAASLLVNVPATIAQDRAFLAVVRGDAEQASAFARRALAELDEGEWLLGSIARGHLAMAEWLRGRLAEAERALVSAIARWRTAGERFLAVRFSELLGYVQRGRGRLDAALATFQGVLEIGAAPGRPVPAAAGMAYVGMAEVAYQRNQLAAALEQVTEGIELCRRFVEAPGLATGLVALAWIRQATGDPAGALAAMGEAGRVAPSPDVTALLNPVPAQRARLALAHGDLTAAARWANQRGLDPDDEPSYQREPEHLVLARVLLAQDRPEQALGLLRRLHDLAAAQGRVGSVIEIQALHALALAASGDEPGALAALAGVLRRAAPEGYVRVFVDEGAPMASLLGRLAAPGQPEQVASTANVPPDYLAWLLAAFPPAAAVGTPQLARRAVAGPLPGLVEPLSERELEVLQLLATGRSNQQIAQELVVALDTVKKHVSRILDKLGVANRTQAVARARELELLG